MPGVDKYDKYTSQQIYTPSSRARASHHHPAQVQQARVLQASAFLLATKFDPTIDAKYLLVSFLMQMYLL